MTLNSRYKLSTPLVVLTCILLTGLFSAALSADAAISSVVTGIPGPSYSFATETVGGTDAHVLIFDNPDMAADYKWQFLTNGVRLLIDRQDGFGWVQLVSEIQSAPEYMKQQGPPGNFVWNTYGLNVTTAGSDVLQGWDRALQGGRVYTPHENAGRIRGGYYGDAHEYVDHSGICYKAWRRRS